MDPATPDREGEQPLPRPHRRSHTTSSDLARYAGLFAQRTRVMRSSAMRDLMEITARPEVISLAGGLPDTSTFPPESFAAQMTRIAQESSAKALQYGPTEGFAETREVIGRGDGRRGDEPRPRRHHRHHRRPAGDRPDLQGADRPGRRRHRRGADLPGRGPRLLLLRGRHAPGRDGRRRDADRPARGAARRARPRGAAAEVHLLGPDLPEPRRRDALARAPAAPGRDRPRARDPDRRGQPLRPAPLRRASPSAALRARRRRLRPLRRHVLEDPLPRDPDRLALRAAAGDGEARARQAGRRPLHLDADRSTSSASTSARAAGATTSASWSRSTAPAATRCSTRWRATSRARRAGPSPTAACSSGRRCPTTSTRPTCWRRRCARTSPSSPARPRSSTARAATSMRLNFSAQTEDEIREGIRRIGAVVGEQVDLFETMTRRAPNRPPPEPSPRRPATWCHSSAARPR